MVSKPSLSALSTPSASPLSQLEIGHTKLADDITSLRKPTVSSSSQRQPKPSTPHVQSPYSARPNTVAIYCYHTTFGVKARRCMSPCSFTSKQSKRVNQAVNTWPITTFGTCTLSLDIGLRRLFPWVFVVADIPCAILGADFLAAFDLLVDCCQSRLHDKTTNLTVRGISSSDAPRQLAVLDPEPENLFRQLLAKYPGLTRPNFTVSIPPHDVVHHIRTTDLPVFSRPRRLAPTRLAAAKAEFEHMLQMGIILQSESPWASPIHMVPKAATGDWRPCGDYRALNNVAAPERYLIPHLQDFVGALFGKSVFSKCGPCLPPNSHRPTGRFEDGQNHPFGLFEFFRIPFGLRNASQTFQSFVDRVLRGLQFVYANIDDLLKVAVIRDLPPLSSTRQQQRLLGMVNFYRRFLSHCADNILPLTSLLYGPKRSFELSADALAAFDKVEADLADDTLLTHFSPDNPISLMVDASNVAVGAVLQQYLTDRTQPLASFFRKLASAETRYTTFGRELLAVFLTVKHFRHLLEDRDVTVFTDLQPLSLAPKCTSDKLNPPGNSPTGLSPGIDLAEMAAEQRRVGPPCDEVVSGLQLQELPLTTGNDTILCDVSTPSHRPFVPPSLRRKVFSSQQHLSHPGGRATKQSSFRPLRLAWDAQGPHSMDTGVSRLSTEQNKAPIGTFPTPDAQFRHVHLDIVGPLPLSNGCSHLFTCVDRFTRWPEATPLLDVAAPAVVKAFLSRWVANFSAPSTITTGRGVQFESNLFQSLLSFLGCTCIRNTAYHPTASGMVKWFHRQLKASLRAADDPENWTDYFPLVRLGIRSSLKSDLDCSAAEPVFGATDRLPGQMISPTPRVAVEDSTNLLHRLRQFMRTLSPVPPRSSVSESYLVKDLATCSHVYLRCDRVRRPLEPPYDGPFRVISRGTKNFRVQRGTREEVVSVDRLKAAVPDISPDEPCGSYPLLLLPDPLFLFPVYFICRYVRDPQLQLPPTQPPTL
ncbi:hypothetical protein SprV_0501778500 [Sparganum proliferum]